MFCVAVCVLEVNPDGQRPVFVGGGQAESEEEEAELVC